MAVSDGFLYLAKAGRGLGVVDVSDPTSPEQAGYYGTIDAARAVAASGAHIYVAEGEVGLQVYKNLLGIEEAGFDRGVPVGALQIVPNPSGGKATLSYCLGFSSPDGARIGIYDLCGRLVRSFDVKARQGKIVWNCRDMCGRKLPGGVYFCLLDGGQEPRIVRKLIILR